MKIPNKVKIGGIVYKILYKDTNRTDSRSLCGYTDVDNAEIIVDDKKDLQVQESTFFHEILEAINFQNELKLEHHQIMVLENNLFQVLKDNNLLR